MTLRAMLMAGAAVAVITGSANAQTSICAPDVPVVLPDHKAFDWSGVYIGVVGRRAVLGVRPRNSNILRNL